MLNKIAYTLAMINMMAAACPEHDAAANGDAAGDAASAANANVANAVADQVKLIGEYVQYAS